MQLELYARPLSAHPSRLIMPVEIFAPAEAEVA